LKVIKALRSNVIVPDLPDRSVFFFPNLTGNVDVAQLLRERGASWELLDKTGSTALHWAVDGANLDMIRWMLQDGCRVDIKDETSGERMMHMQGQYS